jgi:hypothetical protein
VIARKKASARKHEVLAARYRRKAAALEERLEAAKARAS